MKHLFKTLVCGLVSTFLPLFAQGTGTIHGLILDPTGLPVANSKVTASLTERGLQRSTVTDTQGNYVLPALPVGSYSISVEMQGFNSFHQDGVLLTTNENARVDATLQVGNVNQSVSVTSEAPLVDSRSSTVGTLIDSRRVVELPINGRNIISLAGLLPGASQVNAPQTFTGDRSGATVAVSGSRGNDNLFLFDGTEFNASFRNTGLNYPPPDALQEVRVLTNSFSSEYGRNSGAVFNVVTKSGTNEIHGSAWEFLRNQDLNARNFFAPSQKPQLIQNQFGAAAGGPIKKDRLFIFGSYEGLRIRPGSLATSAFPLTTAERAGDFSASKTPVIDPLTGKPFPGNQIPASRFDPVAAKILSQGLMPLPNTPNGQYVTTFPSPQNNDNYLLRMDYNFGRHTIDGHYNYNLATQQTFGGQVPTYLPLDDTGKSQNATIGDTFAISPTLLSEFRLGFTRFRSAIANTAQFGLSDLGASFPAIGPKIPPAIAISGRVTLGNNSTIDSYQVNEAFQLNESVTWTKSNHTVKAGIELLRLRYSNDSYFESMGDFTFGGGITGNPAADFLLGRAESLTVASPAVHSSERQNNVFAFIQDDWKIRPGLTLNLGLRYELPTPWFDRSGNGVTLRPGQQSTVVPTAPLGMVFVGDTGIDKGLYPTDKNNWAPRVGFAWTPVRNGKTVVRGAYGIFYDAVNADMIQWNTSQPFRYTFTIPAPYSLSDPLHGQPALPLSVNLQNPQFVGTQQLFYPDPNVSTPYLQEFNLNVQRELTKDLVVQVGYVGKVGHKLLIGMSANPAVYYPGATLGNVNQRRLLPAFGANNVISSVGNSNYNALQIEATKRFSHGFSMQGSYTWSRSLDMASAISLGAGVPNVFDLHSQYGPSDFNATHIGSVSWLWQVPALKSHSRVMRVIAGGWQLNGLISARSGFPINPLVGSDRALSGTTNQRPDAVGNPVLAGDRSTADKVKQWFNPAAFALPAVGTYGNASRNSLLGPGAFVTNAAVFKDFPLPFRERMKLQFRSEFFNLFNNVNFSNPNATLGPKMGSITSADDARVIQFALKLLF
jgi:outer membrane receptor protein involved in Fe transport